MKLPSRLPCVTMGERGRAVALLSALALLVASCAALPRTAATPATPVASPTDQTRQLTILYTGYGQGEVDPAQPAACG